MKLFGAGDHMFAAQHQLLLLNIVRPISLFGVATIMFSCWLIVSSMATFKARAVL